MDNLCGVSKETAWQLGYVKGLSDAVRHGKWVYDHWCEFKCSECGYFSKSEPIRGKEKYCSNCGAKMDGGK